MWEEDSSIPPEEGDRPSEEGDRQPTQEGLSPEHFAALCPGASPQASSLPQMTSIMDLYQAAHARAVADQQLSKLFNPEYYI
jgi:hypothetical protein